MDFVVFGGKSAGEHSPWTRRLGRFRRSSGPSARWQVAAGAGRPDNRCKRLPALDLQPSVPPQPPLVLSPSSGPSETAAGSPECSQPAPAAMASISRCDSPSRTEVTLLLPLNGGLFYIVLMLQSVPDDQRGGPARPRLLQDAHCCRNFPGARCHHETDCSL
jgi:hypothetical protein